MKAVYFTRFRPVASGHGGSRRVTQLLDCCPDIDWSICSTDSLVLSKPFYGAINKIRLSASRIYGEMKYWQSDYAKHVFAMRQKARLLSQTAKFPDDLQVALVDDPIYLSYLIPWLKKKNIKVVAVAHNLESLSKTQVSDRHQLHLFAQEIQLLKKCDLVVTISREESVLLYGLGINNFYFPYFPTGENLNVLKRVRGKRITASKSHFLLLGTAGNTATKEGMLEVIRLWGGSNKKNCSEKLLVAGYSTESLRESTNDESIEFFGQVTESQLEHLLINVKASLCFQSNASGALTRVCEMLVAGVPVVANDLAARSYYNLPGLFVVDRKNFSSEGLASLADLNKPFQEPTFDCEDELQQVLVDMNEL